MKNYTQQPRRSIDTRARDPGLFIRGLPPTTSTSAPCFENSHVFLGETGGLSLLHGLVGSHPRLPLRLSPSPAPQSAPALQPPSTSTCSAAPERKNTSFPGSLGCGSLAGGDWQPVSEGAHGAAVQRMRGRRSHRERGGR